MRTWLVGGTLAALAAASVAAPPAVTSATLIAEFDARPADLSTDAQGWVTQWRAANNPAIVASLVRTNPPPTPLVTFDSDSMGGAIRFQDLDPARSSLSGNLPGSATGDITIIWLGHYDPDAANYGRYAYSFGRSQGTGATQLTHQSRRRTAGGTDIQIFNGDSTFFGLPIDAYEARPTIWRTEYYAAGDPCHAAWANVTPLDVGGDDAGYTALANPGELFCIGGLQNTGFDFVGRIAVLLVYQGRLSEPDIRAVERYLAARWCPADMSASADPAAPEYGRPDGILDASDFFYYLDRFALSDIAQADLTGSSDPDAPGYGVPDGILDAADFFYYLDRFAAGCG